MFQPLVIGSKSFTVTFKKDDGSVRVMTGTLQKPDYSGTEDERTAYLKASETKQIIPVWTDKGWRSFNVEHIISIEVHG